MDTVIVSIILLAIVGGAAWYVYKSRKKGIKCIGCPNGCNCSSACGEGGCAGCQSQ